jgi:GNAT superfamily N-acetyltransferase
MAAQATSGDVRVADAGDVAVLARALAAAFSDDPVWSWLLPDDASRRRRLERYFALELRSVVLPRGTAFAAPGDVGAALVLPPQQWRLPPAVAVGHGPAYARIFGRRLPRATAYLGRMESRHPRGDHHYVAYVGVVPGHQGRGHGRRLLEPTLERCDREGLPAYLEASSPGNRRLYERLGFVTFEELRFLGSPPLALMLRAPQT